MKMYFGFVILFYIWIFYAQWMNFINAGIIDDRKEILDKMTDISSELSGFPDSVRVQKLKVEMDSLNKRYESESKKWKAVWPIDGLTKF